MPSRIRRFLVRTGRMLQRICRLLRFIPWILPRMGSCFEGSDGCFPGWGGCQGAPEPFSNFPVFLESIPEKLEKLWNPGSFFFVTC